MNAIILCNTQGKWEWYVENVVDDGHHYHGIRGYRLDNPKIAIDNNGTGVHFAKQLVSEIIKVI
jgi:hypothetical protein